MLLVGLTFFAVNTEDGIQGFFAILTNTFYHHCLWGISWYALFLLGFVFSPKSAEERSTEIKIMQQVILAGFLTILLAGGPAPPIAWAGPMPAIEC